MKTTETPPVLQIQIRSVAVVALQVLSWNLSGGVEEGHEICYDGSAGTVTLRSESSQEVLRLCDLRLEQNFMSSLISG